LEIRLVVYTNDILLMAETKEKARDQASSLIYMLQCLGFTVNMEKMVLDPSQCLEFLGFMIDTTKMQLSLPAQKQKRFGRVLTVIRGGACNSLHPLKTNWENECYKSSDPTSSTVLQEPTNEPDGL
uniref:Reverse transcriptase domain-containing protein n=1 Tax=Amphimedon queenslandica TaxID=400682 RepID=A0A1X7VWX4_AMPQE